MTNQAPPPAMQAVKNLLVSSIRPLFFVIVSLAVLWFIGKQIGGDASILKQLNDTPTARGLITFVVATATVAGALILVLAAIISEGTENDIKMRLSEGRQILAPLIGVLGTIVGFYFGQATPPAGQAGAANAGQAQELRIANVNLTPAEVAAAGGSVTVTGTVTGGRGPYTYSITFTGLPKPVTGTTDGKIEQAVTVPAGAKTPLTIQLEVADAAKTTAKAEKALKVGS